MEAKFHISAVMAILLYVPALLFGQSITIQPGVRMTVQNGASLKATGSMGITVKSDAAGAGSFLDQNDSPGTVTFGGTQTVERYISGDTRYHMFSAAVESATFGTIFPTDADKIWVRQYIEATNTYVNRIYNESSLQGIGYTVYLSGISSTTATFTGALGTGTIAKGSALTGIDITGPGNGWNLVGNPYPSAISWNALTKTDLLASVYAWNAAGGNWDSYNGSAGALTNGIIPSGQGFFVQVTGSSPTLTFENACRVHGSSALYYKSLLKDLLTLRVTTSANAYSDRVFVYFDPNATNAFDPQYDAYKLRGEADAPELFATGDPILSIDVLRSVEESPVIPLGFKAGATADYTITAEGMESFSPGTRIYLDDHVTGIKTDLNETPIYSFQSDQGEVLNRFTLRFSTVGIEDNELSALTAFAKDRTVYLHLPNTLNGTVAIYDILGRSVYSGKLQSPGIMKIPLNGTPGIYIVSVVANNAQKTMKIFIN